MLNVGAGGVGGAERSQVLEKFRRVRFLWARLSLHTDSEERPEALFGLFPQPVEVAKYAYCG